MLPGGAALKALARWTRQLSVLLLAGIPIHRSLDVLAGTGSELPKPVVEGLLTQLRQGRSLSESLKSYPAVFPPLLVAGVRTGERTGALVAVIERLAEVYERSADFRARTVSKLTYPLLLLVSCGALLVLLVLFFLPLVGPMLAQWDVAPPPPLRALLSLSDILRHPLSLVLAGLLLLNGLAGAWFLRRDEARRHQLVGAWDAFLDDLPGVGKLRLQAARARVMDALALLLAAGVPAAEALEHARLVAGHRELALRLQDAAVGLMEGLELGRSLGESRVLEGRNLQLFLAGEATGRLAAMLQTAYQLEEDDLHLTLDTLVALAEPLILTLMGVVVGGLSLAALLPLLSVLGRL